MAMCLLLSTIPWLGNPFKRLPAAAGLGNQVPPSKIPAFRKDKSWKSCPRK
jgi:hypothetical protein